MRNQHCSACGRTGHNERSHQRRISNPPPRDNFSTHRIDTPNVQNTEALVANFEQLLATTRQAATAVDTLEPISPAKDPVLHPRMDVNTEIIARTDADGQPVAFTYKVVERTRAQVVVRMVRADGSLGEKKKYRVHTNESGSEYVKIAKYLWASPKR